MSGLLANKVAVVTGAASGIGKAVCSRFLAEGAKVLMVDKNQDLLSKTLDDFGHDHAKSVKMFTGNVADETTAIDAFKTISSQFSVPSTVLVNCAGGGISSPINKTTVQDFKTVVDGNLLGVFIFTKHFLQNLEYGRNLPLVNASIVNIASMAGKVGMDRHASYAAAKSGVIAFTKSTCMEVARYGIRCNAILPGFVETPILDKISESYLAASVQMNPLKRLGKPHEVANSCLFLASDESSYVNGAALEVSGGLMA
uniref:Estradiol 17-beta-dehydrogenase 8-like n=1 Tax=Phallusia mammillata TaxID=59560 RepID=A0A6F9DFG6_9ASCI|nr:estradiol 17-beta-dehydrogenase 8-like [Phallusia mammillata]